MSVGVHVRGEILITQQLACGRVQNSRIARRSGEDSPVDWYRTQGHLDGAGARLIRVTVNDRHQALTSPRAHGHTAKWNAAKPKRRRHGSADHRTRYCGTCPDARTETRKHPPKASPAPKRRPPVNTIVAIWPQHNSASPAEMSAIDKTVLQGP